MKTVEASCPGACGELFQGALGGTPCLVSCPIDLRSVIRAASSPGEGLSLPPGMVKTERAAKAFLTGRTGGGRSYVLERLRGLPEGKGYASSTADILAALACLSSLEGVSLSPEEGTAIALSVEPTDSLAWPGLALLDHRRGQIMEYLGPPPSMSVLVLDWGGVVDTEKFNMEYSPSHLEPLATLHREAFSLVRGGTEEGDPEKIGRGASMSARAWNKILEKPRLEECFALCERLGGFGVCAAHSGTLCGILLPPVRETDGGEILEKAAAELPSGWTGSLRQVTGGGAKATATGKE